MITKKEHAFDQAEKIRTDKAKPVQREVREEDLIRILSTDIPGNNSVYAGLAKIKGISWGFSNAICRVLGISRDKKIKDLSEQEIKKIIDFAKNPKVPSFIMNRRKDFDSGQDKHLIGTDVDLNKEFDIKRLKKIRSYKGLRHVLGQPVRGQRTRSHFRKNKAVGVVGKGKKGPKS